MNKYEKAIHDSVKETIKKLGLQALKDISWFPSKNKP